MNMLAIRAGVEPAIGCGDRLELTGYRSLEVPGPGAVAHMSLHQKLTMSKSHSTLKTGQQVHPRFTPGDRLSRYVGDRALRERLNRQRRVGGAHLGALLDSVNAFLQFYFVSWSKAPGKRRNPPFFASSALRITGQLAAFRPKSSLPQSLFGKGSGDSAAKITPQRPQSGHG